METFTERPTARHRLLDTADRLFYQHGIHAVGIDRIVAESGVAKSTMYVHFRTKEELIVAYLRRRSDMTRTRVTAGVEARSNRPVGDRVLAVFDVLDEIASEPHFRGCPFVNAAAEYPDHHGIWDVINYDRSWLPRLLAELLSDADVPDASNLVRQLVQLYDGANVMAHLDQSKNSAKMARTAAKHLVADLY
ncbi:MAG TPA: TetR/AcrR family transcriptional regulator [Candidatus Yaniella excrementavium]|nr:TetR/AcrR family transcriptional regulator [Candidatus Yaniella excrementavium]